ncbi:MAG: hypothetical protein IPL38_07720 [Rhodobacter sp.]|nr:hypothetical protein [Rhodobacter sp.]
MKRMILVLATLALASCVEEGPGGGPQGKQLTEAERADCLMRGGTTGYGGLFPDELCFTPMKDAGQSCTKAGDCEGQCLADTKTCSKVSPIFGCYDYLDETGQVVGICVD